MTKQIAVPLQNYQSKLKIIICIHLEGLESPVLYTKLQRYWSFGSSEYAFKGVKHIWVLCPSWSCM